MAGFFYGKEVNIVAITKEAIGTIVNFCLPDIYGEVLSPRQVYLGETGGYGIFFGRVSYQLRVQELDGEPLIPKWTKQPIVALVKRDQVTTLAYAIDVRNLEEPLAAAVAERLSLWNSLTLPEEF